MIIIVHWPLSCYKLYEKWNAICNILKLLLFLTNLLLNDFIGSISATFLLINRTLLHLTYNKILTNLVTDTTYNCLFANVPNGLATLTY